MKIEKYVNKQCVGFGFFINWNYRYSIVIDFLFWEIEILFNKTKGRKYEKK